MDLDAIERELKPGKPKPANDIKPPKKEEKFNSSAKFIDSQQISQASKDDEDEIDEFIKRHLEEDSKSGKETPKQQMTDDESGSSSNESSTNLSPRQALLNALVRLSEPTSNDNKYSLNDRELFIFDLESILKVLTFKEVCLLVFPCLEVYAVEQEYLKIELFRQLPHVFKKVMKCGAKMNGEKLTED